MKEQVKNNNNNKLRYLLIGVLLVVVGAYGLSVWLKSKHHETTDNAQLDANIISVRSAVSGFVVEVRFKDNQRVKMGDTLAIIDKSDYEAKVIQARAMLKSAEVQTGVSRSSAQAATESASASVLNSSAMKANIESAQARLTRSNKDVARVRKMFAEGAATQQQLEAVNAENESASAQFVMTSRQYQASANQATGARSSAKAQQNAIGVSNAIVEQRKAELELAETQLKHTLIIAPFEGIVSKKTIEVGQLVQYGQPLCSAIEMNDLWVTANFKETQLEKIRVGEEVRIRLDAYPDLQLKGKVESIGGATGAKFSLIPADNATGNFVKVTQRVPVRIMLDKYDSSGYTLSPGLSAFVDVELN